MYSLFARSRAFDQIHPLPWFTSGRMAGSREISNVFALASVERGGCPFTRRCERPGVKRQSRGIIARINDRRGARQSTGGRGQPHVPSSASRGMLSANEVESLQASASLRAYALLEFGLPAAPERIEELPAPVPTTSACRVSTPEGRFLLLCAAAPLALAFEATFFDLLVEARFPVPGPRRARAGGLIAVLANDGGPAAASCYAWPPGERLDPATA